MWEATVLVPGSSYYTQLNLTCTLSSLACLGKHGLENPGVAVCGWSPLGQDTRSVPVLIVSASRGCVSGAMARAGVSMATPQSASENKEWPPRDMIACFNQNRTALFFAKTSP